jgi:carbon-monoxide dehydrogenase large subunit
MAIDRVRYDGEPVALVVAESEEAAEEGAQKIEVSYKELPAVFDPVKAVKDNSVLIHPDLGSYQKVDFLDPQPGTNIANRFKIRKGDVEKAFKEAAVVMEETVSCPQIGHGFLEPYCCISHEDPATGNLTVWTSTQSPFAVQEILAQGLGYPLHKIRVIAPPVGGGFGGKAGMTIEALCLAAAMDSDLARGWQLNLDPREVQKMIGAISSAVDDMIIKNLMPVLLVHPNVRLIVRRLIEGSLSGVFVVYYNEIASGIQIKTVGMVE